MPCLMMENNILSEYLIHLKAHSSVLKVWITFFVYIWAIWSCLQAAWAGRTQTPAKTNSSNRFWLMATWVLVFLSLSHWLGIQTALTNLLRELSKMQGWYEIRRPIQAAYIIFILFIGGFICKKLDKSIQKFGKNVSYAGLTLVLLFTYVLIRSSSFHYVDSIVESHFLGIPVNIFLVYIALGIIALNAWSFKRKHQNANQTMSSKQSK